MPPKDDWEKSARAGSSKDREEPSLTRKEILTIGLQKRGSVEEKEGEEEEQDHSDKWGDTNGVQYNWRREL